ncbi:lipopolysaccharide biosynthesis protein [Halieaceae bacterium IMCC14734]|uniref:Lipopolysaccharide biosynthesis protein n=2 Tax=Candidatus Litorirhabdus singularis TaxID=2518993 RepID=A0ABT3TIL4_9GAMM|nr:lipopolysaccharide biosynthesis protein [Candidatus Litorirhabdus singularis]
MSGMKQKASKGVFWSLAENIGVLGINFLAFLVLARLLDKEAFGLVALAMAYVLFLELFVRTAAVEVIIQRKTLSDLHKNTAFWATASLGVVALLLSLLIASNAGTLSGEDQLEHILYWLSLGIIPLSLSTVQNGIMVREIRFKGLAARRIIASTSSVIVALVFALNGMGVWSLVAQLLTYRFADFLALYWVTKWFPKLHFSWSAFKDMSDYGWKVLASNIAYFAGSQLDRVIIGHFLGVKTLGIYVVGQKLIEVIYMTLNGVVGRVALTTFSRLQTDQERLKQACLSVGQLTTITAVPVLMFLAVSAVDIIAAVFGDKWSDSAAVTQILAIAAIARISFVFLMPALKAKAMAGRVMTAIILQAALSVCFAILLAPLGLVAMTIGWSVGYIASTAMLIYFVGDRLSINLTELIRIFAAPLVSAFVGVLVVFFLSQQILEWNLSMYVAMGIKLCAFILAYLGSLAAIAPKTVKNAYTDISSLLINK